MYTTENNKKLSIFMGNAIVDSNNNHKDTYNYHNDWNSLMQVVEKIESLGFEFFIVESRCKIAHNTDKSIETIIDFEIIGTKIEAVYNSCIEFVEWYNKEQEVFKGKGLFDVMEEVGKIFGGQINKNS